MMQEGHLQAWGHVAQVRDCVVESTLRCRDGVTYPVLSAGLMVESRCEMLCTCRRSAGPLHKRPWAMRAGTSAELQALNFAEQEPKSEKPPPENSRKPCESPVKASARRHVCRPPKTIAVSLHRLRRLVRYTPEMRREAPAQYNLRGVLLFLCEWTRIQPYMTTTATTTAGTMDAASELWAECRFPDLHEIL
ncbi:unnamed protein product [Symbiodinium natans]|uniref:Uncharacterized protein n=1 Tax=Symbiodinium natans TaxID=878477 RepID=A0A812V087_9DINO|nr:unnamed protein product [Symbiodinium natans]